jgi:hypothetical protein
MDPTEQALSGQASAHVYSLSRPLHPLLPQTKQFRDLEDYTYQHSIQVSIGTLQGHAHCADAQLRHAAWRNAL